MKRFICLFITAAFITAFSGCAAGTDAPVSEISSDTQSTSDVSAESSQPKNRFESYDFNSYSENIQYNENVDLSLKPIPHGYTHAEYGEPRDTADLIDTTDGAVVIHVLDSDTFEHSLTGDPELDKIFAEKTGNPDAAKLEGRIVQAEVQYTVFGDFKTGDILTISLYDEVWGQELTAGKDYLITPRYLETYDEHVIPDGINGIFEIKEDFTVVSQSFMYHAAKYDGLSLADIAHDFDITSKELAKANTP